MRNDLPLMVGLVLVIVQSLCLADTPPDLAGINVGELSQVQTETILLKAKAEREKARRSLVADASPTPAPATAAYPPLSPIPGSASPSTDAARTTALPVVSMISGSSNAPHATLLYSNGTQVDAHSIGSALPGGLRLVSVSVDGVVVSQDGKNIPLGFSNHTPVQ